MRDAETLLAREVTLNNILHYVKYALIEGGRRAGVEEFLLEI
jgi:hypothetical protein